MASFVLYPTDGSPQLCPLDPEQVITIGRHPDNLCVIASESASSHHATVSQSDGNWFVQDLGSSNGTRINGAPIEEAQLNDGDRVQFGDIQAIYYENDADAAAASTLSEVIESPILMPDAIKSSPAKKAAPPARRNAPPPAKSKLLPAERLAKTMRAYPGQDTAGCSTALMIAGLFALAVLLGLMLRHQSETGRNFLSDAVSSLFGKVPKITIEKTEP